MLEIVPYHLFTCNICTSRGSLSVAGKRVLYQNSNDKYEKHPYVMRLIYTVFVSLMTAACKTYNYNLSQLFKDPLKGRVKTLKKASF